MIRNPNIIYMITHNVTKRMYIGRTTKLKHRLKSHFNNLRKGTHPIEDMQTDFDLYGEDYTIKILKEDSRGRDEYDFMDLYNSRVRGIGYNYKDNHGTPKQWGYYKAKLEMTRAGITYDDIGKAIGYSSGIASMKLNGKYPLTLNEARIIRDMIAPNVSIDILFEEAS